MTTYTPDGRELHEAVARAMGWTVLAVYQREQGK